MRRMLTLCLTAMLTFVLAGCAGIPSSGPVKPGSALGGTDTSSIEFFPAGPITDATPEQILRGFLEAASGPQNDYAVAKQFLTPEFQTKWDPNAGVAIDTSLRTITMGPDNTATLSSTVSATIDGSGQYAELAIPTTRTVSYSFAQVKGQWRLSSAPQGINLERPILDLIYQTYPIYFFDPSYRFLVPDVRWFARASSTTTRITKALLSGPAPWLSSGNAVVTAFPAGTALVANSVPVIKDVATADFTSALNTADPIALTRIKQQLTASLLGVNSVATVDLYVEGVPLGQGAQSMVDAVMPLPVDNRAFVISERGVGYLDGDFISNSPVYSGALTGNYSAVTLAQSNRYATTLSADGVGIVRPGSNSTMIDTRPGLIAPSIDRYNIVWSAPRMNLADLSAITPDGATSKIAVSFTANQVVALELSHDGARVAVLYIDAAGPKLVVASVIRGENGVPVRLGGTVSLPVPAGNPVDIAWIDATSVAVMSNTSGASVVLNDVIGGRSLNLPTFVSGTAVSLAGGNNVNQLRVLSADGRLYSLRSPASWSFASAGIKVLGVQQ